jgi:putative DNA methylase
MENMEIKYNKKLIEVALPLEAINKASAHEKMPGIGPHPRGLHLWWARRPLATARAVIFAQMVDDPSACPDLFPTVKAQEKERKRLFKIIEELVLWENTNNEAVLEKAKAEIWRSWRRTCAENADHPQAKELFDRNKLPAFHDPFAGGGALPLEAQRLGLESYAGDLNPVAVLINKSMIEIPSKFAGKPPINAEARKNKELFEKKWEGAKGLAEDVRYYGKWMRNEAEKSIGKFYPKVEVTAEMVSSRPDLKNYLGQKLSVIAWLWARTVKSPNPAFASVDVPLVSNFMLSNKIGKEAYVEPVVNNESYVFSVNVGKPKNLKITQNGTKSGGSGSSFLCLMSGTPIPFEYVREEAKAGRMGARLMAIVAEGVRGRIYLPPTLDQEEIARQAKLEEVLETELPKKALGFRIQEYGMTKWRDLFTARQLTALITLSDLVKKIKDQVTKDGVEIGLANDGKTLVDGGSGATAYADAIATYLAFTIDRCADFSNTCTRWVPGNQKVMNLFGKQAIAMTWDFPEAAILEDTVGGFVPACNYITECIEKLPLNGNGFASQADAATSLLSKGKVISTDPPYYDNIGYADLSDFFYVWLRRSLKSVFPELFSTLTVPKAEELVATPFRHGNKEKAEEFFLSGMTRAMHNLSENANPSFPVTIYYAFKQSENEGEGGTASTGWETFLDAVIRAGFSITGTWPMRSEQEHRMIGIGTNALASSIVLVCRPRLINAPTATRREFINDLKNEMQEAINHLQRGNIAPVDLAQAAIGPGMAIYTRHAKVLDAAGKEMSVREALTLINEILDEVMAQQEGDFDSDSRWALTWFEHSGFVEGEYGVAETLATARNTSVSGMKAAGILTFGKGKVRLFRPEELLEDWNPETDTRLTAWEIVHHLIRVLESKGEGAAADLVNRLGSNAELARELAYRLYTICERKKRSKEAISYNALVQSWPEITRLAREDKKTIETQTEAF